MFLKSDKVKENEAVRTGNRWRKELQRLQEMQLPEPEDTFVRFSSRSAELYNIISDPTVAVRSDIWLSLRGPKGSPYEGRVSFIVFLSKIAFTR